MTDGIEAAEAELAERREALEKARKRVGRLAGQGAGDEALGQAVAGQEDAAFRVELSGLRLAGLRERALAAERAHLRGQELASVREVADRLAGWRKEFLEAASDADAAFAAAAEALGRMEACGREVMECAPRELRGISRLTMPIAVCRGVLHAGLQPYLPMTHPWGDRKHWGPLCDPEGLPEVEAELARLLRAKRAA